MLVLVFVLAVGYLSGLIRIGSPQMASDVVPRVVATEGQGRLELWGDTKVLFLKGGPYERGYQHGVLARDEVRRMVGFAQRCIAQQDVPGIRDRLTALESNLVLSEREEMRGIAEGAGVDYEDILTVNLFAEIVQGCSQFAVIGGPDGPVLGRNVDIDPNVASVFAQSRLVQVVIPGGALPYFAPSLAGMAGTFTGINIRGVYAGANAPPLAAAFSEGVPVVFLQQRLLMQATSAKEAEDLLTSSLPSVGQGQGNGVYLQPGQEGSDPFLILAERPPVKVGNVKDDQRSGGGFGFARIRDAELRPAGIAEGQEKGGEHQDSEAH